MTERRHIHGLLPTSLTTLNSINTPTLKGTDSDLVRCRIITPFSAMASCSLLLAVIIALASVTVAVIKLEKTKHNSATIEYESNGLFRESLAWDAEENRFLVTGYDGSIGYIQDNKEVTVVKDADYAGNATLGLKIDRERSRVIVAIADIKGGFRYNAIAAYHLTTWKRIFLTQLSGSGDERAMANDVAVDGDGNVYVTDLHGGTLWKVTSDGDEVIWMKDLGLARSKIPLSLNGVVYHPDGYLLVAHTLEGSIYKVDLGGPHGVHIRTVNMSGVMLLSDGIAMLSPERLVVTSWMPSARIIESTDGWATAKLTHRYVGPFHRIATSVAMKDDQVFISYLLGFKSHLITKAIFHLIS